MRKLSVAALAFTAGVLLSVFVFGFFFNAYKHKNPTIYDEKQALSLLADTIKENKSESYSYFKIYYHTGINENWEVTVDYGDIEYTQNFYDFKSLYTFISDKTKIYDDIVKNRNLEKTKE